MANEVQEAIKQEVETFLITEAGLKKTDPAYHQVLNGLIKQEQMMRKFKKN